MEAREARAREVETSGDACDVFSGRSWLGFAWDWLGFAWDWLFCRSMPFIWQLDEQNNDIRDL